MTSAIPEMSPAPILIAPEPTPAPPQPKSWAERALWALVGVFIVNWSVTLLAPASYYPGLAVLTVLSGLWGVAVVIGSLLDVSAYPLAQRAGNYFAWFNAIVVLALIGVWAYLQLRTAPGFGTDELAFDQYAAQLLTHGSNPYLHSMAPSFHLFKLSPDQYSYTTTGKEVLSLSYPALSFLIYVPFILLGLHTQVALIVDIGAWILTALLMFKLLPRNMRAVALVIGCVSVYLGTVTGGDTDVLYLPLLILAAFQWDRFGQSRRTYLGPLALGLAMAVKQTPWPILLFVLCALVLDELDRSDLDTAVGRAGRYLAAVAGGFLLPNVAFILMSPSAWFHGVVTPFTNKLVPSGQGIVALTLFDHLGGGSLSAFTLTMLLVGLLILVIYIGTYPLLRPGTFLLAAIAYMFAARSQTNYLIEFIPVVFVGAATIGLDPNRSTSSLGDFNVTPVGAHEGARERASRWVTAALARRPDAPDPLRSRAWALGIAGTAVLALAATVYALSAPSPLGLTITGIQTTGYLGGIDELTVSVHNRTDQTLTPYYTVQTTHDDTTFWRIAKGPRKVAAGETAVVELAARNYPAEPGTLSGFSVLAFTNSPAAVSVSHRYLRSLLHTQMLPGAFNQPIVVGKPFEIQVQLLDSHNNTVSRGGVAVYLTQTVYTPLGHANPKSQIDGNKPGKLAVAYTNSQGLATFKIVGAKPSTIPVTFSSHLFDKSAGYVYGSGGYLNVTFVG